MEKKIENQIESWIKTEVYKECLRCPDYRQGHIEYVGRDM